MESKRITDRELFIKPAEELAPWLLGKIICHRVHDENGEFIIRGRISVTEAYCEKEDVTDATKAEKNGKMISQHKSGGHLYVSPERRGGCRFDIVANEEGKGEGVLVRGIDAYQEGPYIAAWALDIDKSLDGKDLLDPEKEEIWLESDNAEIIQNEPTCRKNLGKNASEESKAKLLRFTIKEIKFLK